MLPVPLIEEPRVGGGGAQRRRKGGLRAAVRLANNAVRTLNLLLGFSSSAGPSGGSLHDAVRAEAVERSYYFKPDSPNALCTDEAALSELLKGRSCYDVSRSACSVKPFSSGPVALPSDLIDCLYLHDALPEDDRQFLEGNHERMRNHDQQHSKQFSATSKPYFDESLRRNRRTYVKFVRRLVKLGLFRVTLDCKCEIGLFFVAKKNGSLRMIIDARPANSVFRKPPHTPLCNSEVFANIESTESCGVSFEDLTAASSLPVYLGMADVDNCFHRIRIDEGLGQYFCLPSLFSAKELDIVGQTVSGVTLSASSQVRVCCQSLPMGFGWSLYFAQRINETRMQQSKLLDHSQLVNDNNRTIVFNRRETSLFHFVYVDNLGVLALRQEQVENVMEDLECLFSGGGLSLHEKSVGTDRQESLGTSLDCRRQVTALTVKRFWRLYKSISAILRRKKISGMCLEIVLGHCTFCALVDRRLLSLFHAVYRFVQANYTRAAPIWVSVRFELQCFRDLMIYLMCPWRLPWSPVVTATDSSLSGFGATRATLPPSVVSQHGRQSERPRFKKLPQGSARTKALIEAGVVQLVPGVCSEGEEWYRDTLFPEVPAQYLKRSLWSECMRGRWRDVEDISVLEIRTVVRAVFDLLKYEHMHRHRLLFLGDNMGVVLACCRSRARSFRFIVQLRKLAALCWIMGVRISFRWIPSELNSSDLASRAFDEGPEKTDILAYLDTIFPEDVLAQSQFSHQYDTQFIGSGEDKSSPQFCGSLTQDVEPPSAGRGRPDSKPNHSTESVRCPAEGQQCPETPSVPRQC